MDIEKGLNAAQGILYAIVALIVLFFIYQIYKGAEGLLNKGNESLDYWSNIVTYKPTLGFGAGQGFGNGNTYSIDNEGHTVITPPIDGSKAKTGGGVR